MKADWWETGRQLQKEWLAAKQEARAIGKAGQEEFDRRWKGSFQEAVFAFDRGDPSLLAAYLRSDRPLSPKQRSEWADYMEGKPKRQPQRGRPRDGALHSVATAASWFYRDWKRRNKELGVSSHGHAEAMKVESIRFVLEELEPPSEFIDPSDVLELMDRAKYRQ